jgi:tripartite-type tricarboxylate transporter receptor subunit TctC
VKHPFQARLPVFAPALLALGLATPAQQAAAQAYPTKPITIVVPYSAGGSSDVLTRAVAKHLSESLGRSVVVENRAGASGMIGAEAVSRATPDGYMLLGTTSSYPGTVATRKEIPFDPVKSFVPVATIARAPQVLAVHPSVPAKNVKEFIEYAKKNPGKVTYASSGTGGNNHFSAALFASQAGLKMTHVPYKGIAPAVTALASGEVDSVIASHSALLPMLKGNRIRAIAVTSLEPSELIPGLPAINRAGLPGYEYELWWGIFAPAGTPADRVQMLNAAVNKALATPEMKQFLQSQGVEAWPRPAAEIKDLLAKEIARYRQAAKEAGIEQH